MAQHSRRGGEGGKVFAYLSACRCGYAGVQGGHHLALLWGTTGRWGRGQAADMRYTEAGRTNGKAYV